MIGLRQKQSQLLRSLKIWFNISCLLNCLFCLEHITPIHPSVQVLVSHLNDSWDLLITPPLYLGNKGGFRVVWLATLPPHPPPLHHNAAKHKWTNTFSQSRLLNNQGRHPRRWAVLPWRFRTPGCAMGWPCPACREVWQRDLSALLPCPRTRCHCGIIEADRVAPGLHKHRGPHRTIRKNFSTKRGRGKVHVKLGI